MIVFEAGAAPSARSGEAEIGGRRITGRLLPYAGESGAQEFRFDPLARRFVGRRDGATVLVGPADPEPWRAAAAKLPRGPILVGPASVAEGVRGAYRAAAEGALSAGYPAFLLDPEPEGVPDRAEGAIALCSFAPSSGRRFPHLAAAVARGLACGVILPWIPGWTAEEAEVEAILAEAAEGGAVSATPLVPESDGESRRAIVEARSGADAQLPDGFFERIHHADWSPAIADRLARFRERCAELGLALAPPRPVGRGEPAGNSAAASRLEGRADAAALDEHRAALLRAAVRWIDESGRDLAAVCREGNFRRVFPFEEEIASEAEAALRSGG
jgi:hypothetical protein